MRWGIPFIIEDEWYDEVQQELLNKLNEHITLEVIMTQPLQAPVAPVAGAVPAQPVQQAPVAAPVAQPVQVQPAPVAQAPVAQAPPAEVAPVAVAPVAPSWDDVSEGGGGIDIPGGVYFGTLVHVAWADCVNDFDKDNPKPYKGIKFVFSLDVLVGTAMQKALITTGFNYLQMSLGGNSKLKAVLSALLGGGEVSLDALKALNMVTFFTEKLGTKVQLGISQAPGKKNPSKMYSNVDTYSAAVTQTPDGTMGLLPKLVDFTGIEIPAFYFKDTTYTVSIAPAPTVA